MSRRRTVAALAAVVVVASGATAGAARADDGDLYIEGCLARTAATGCPAGLPGAPLGLAQSPDGQQLYVAMNASGGGSYFGLKIFDRDASTGVATPRSGPASCFAPAGTGVACTLVPGGVNFSTAWDVAVGPDGRNVYLVTFNGSLFNFARDPATGALTYVNCVGNGTPCTDLIANAAAMSVAVSPDSQNVYVKTSIGLAVLDRDGNTRQVAQKPTFDGCFSEGIVADCDEVDGLNGESYGMVVSPDGRHVYVAFRSPGGVGIFNRAPDGKLSQPNGQAGGCVSANGNSAEALRCRDGNDYLSESFVTTISPDGRSVYVGGRYGIFSYARDQATGYLTEIGCFGAGPSCARATPGLDFVFDLAVSPDGGELVSAPYASRAIVSFIRDPATGALTQRSGPRGCVANPAGGCQALALLVGNQMRLAMDPSGLRFYATSNSGMLATITRDYAPTCSSSTVGAPFNTLISVPLACADANGDVMILDKGTLPLKGQLGEISNNTVFYSPFANYAGPDSFTYRAITPTRGVAGPYATVDVNVAGPPAAPPIPLPGGGGIDNDRDGFFAGQDCNDSNAAIRPGAQEIRGNRTDENCDGTAEAFPTLTSGVVNKWDVKGTRLTLTALQVTQQFPNGWKVKITCKGKPKCTFASKTLKAGKVKKGVATIITSLSKRQRRFRAGQTVEVWVSAPNFNTKVARFVLKRNRIPTTQPYCVLPGSTRVQKTCT